MRFNATLALAYGSVLTLGCLLGCNGASNSTDANSHDEDVLVFDTGKIDPKLEGTIKIDGSSTVYKVSQAAAEEFGNVARNIDISVKYAGTGGGFKNFVQGELDICDASRPIQESEMALCKANGVEYIELPICFDALTIAVNAKNDWANDITTDELKKLWETAAEGKITTWSQVREGWPNEKITLYGAGTDSGTFEYFTEAIVEKKNASRSDYTASENDNDILRGIEGDKNALGYVPYAYYEPRKDSLKALKIDWSQDEAGPIEPSPASVVQGVYNPLSRPLFIYVNRKSAERPEVKAFVDFYLLNGKQLAQEVKYIPLPDTAYPAIAERFNKLQVGTGFGGHSKVGLHIDEVLKIEPQL